VIVFVSHWVMGADAASAPFSFSATVQGKTVRSTSHAELALGVPYISLGRSTVELIQLLHRPEGRLRGKLREATSAGVAVDSPCSTQFTALCGKTLAGSDSEM
jgi:hypothetical protein